MIIWSKRHQSELILRKVIETHLSEMLDTGWGDEDLKKLSSLYKLLETETSRRVDANTVLTVAGSLAGILLIIGYERANVLTSKAVGFVMRLR